MSNLTKTNLVDLMIALRDAERYIGTSRTMAIINCMPLARANLEIAQRKMNRASELIGEMEEKNEL